MRDKWLISQRINTVLALILVLKPDFSLFSDFLPNSSDGIVATDNVHRGYEGLAYREW